MAGKPKEKVFCIGMNKTGTTSLERFMSLHGYRCGDQAKGELLLGAFASGDYRPIIDFCHTADFFQDLPFSAPGCHAVLLKAFPGAKFILTLRDSADIWYDSLVRFHEKVFGKPLSKPTLMNVQYRYPSFAWEANRALYDSPEDDPYHRQSVIEAYNDHHKAVVNDFEKNGDLLVLNVADDRAVERLSLFLGIEPKTGEMPWLNKTAEA